MIKTLPKSLALLCALGVMASVGHYLQDSPYNPSFSIIPSAVHAHVVLGGLFLLLVPLQFFSRLRGNGTHKATGRVLVSIGLVIGVTALIITLVMPYSGNAERLFITPFALFFLYAIITGFFAARARDFQRHQAMMIRAIAIATAVVTMRIVFIPSMIWFGSEELTPEVLSIASFTFAFIFHSAFAEWWIRTRSTGAAEITGDLKAA